MRLDGCRILGMMFILLVPFLLAGQVKEPSSTSIKVLSWNIQMLPNAMGPFSAALRKKQRHRLPWIVQHCKKQDYDVIVFQEVFDIHIKKRLLKALKETYPNQVKTRRTKGRITSNGIVIVSKLPMKYIDHVIYQKGVHADAWASKGCTLVEVDNKGIKIQIAGTHLQAGSSEEAKEHRASQYLEIKGLLDKNKVPDQPVLVIGDMNTARANEAKYNLMLESIDVVDCELKEERPFTIDSTNSWNKGEIPKQLDYILLQKRATNTRVENLQIIRPTALFRKKQVMDLADHYGVVGEIILD